ncbi:MAG: tRNA guanosine(34) transglycosylase Tgt [Opitutales bacterium]|nr:tRNA guanosine(34) transglycosylase Tgt [Opitutales bacterium]
MPDHFRIHSSDSATAARRAELHTPHGTIQTPVFMPVGTQATVKSLTPHQVKECGAQIILSNTYHLNLRPGPDLIAKLGGLHEFMNWKGPILTDSGGFQVFSLAKLRKMDDEGIRFRSHIDGREVYLNPSIVMDIQNKLGSDIAMVLDECPPWPPERKVVESAVRRSIKWAGESIEAQKELGIQASGRHVFGIVQGSAYADLRRECAQALSALPFNGYAIGGVSVGEPEDKMLEAIDASVPYLPTELPRYVMGVGTPPQLLRMIAKGIDMFDCVMPTREARHGVFYTVDGRRNIKNACFAEDKRPLCEENSNYTCEHFSRAYIRHLFQSSEILACTLLSLHNVNFFVSLLDQARMHLENGTFASWSKSWINRFENPSQ